MQRVASFHGMSPVLTSSRGGSVTQHPMPRRNSLMSIKSAASASTDILGFVAAVTQGVPYLGMISSGLMEVLRVYGEIDHFKSEWHSVMCTVMKIKSVIDTIYEGCQVSGHGSYAVPRSLREPLQNLQRCIEETLATLNACKDTPNEDGQARCGLYRLTVRGMQVVRTVINRKDLLSAVDQCRADMNMSLKLFNTSLNLANLFALDLQGNKLDGLLAAQQGPSVIYSPTMDDVTGYYYPRDYADSESTLSLQDYSQTSPLDHGLAGSIRSFPIQERFAYTYYAGGNHSRPVSTMMNVTGPFVTEDGYIAHTLNSRNTRRYLSFLLGMNASSIQPILWGNKFFVAHPPIAHVQPQCISPIDGRPLWLIDYRMDSARCAVVPQTLLSDLDEGMHDQLNVRFQLPVFFTRFDGRLGVTLPEAAMDWSGPVGANEFAQVGDQSTICLCLNALSFADSEAYHGVQWPGYAQFKTRIGVRDTQCRPIVISRLARRVGRFIDGFIEATRSVHSSSQWRVGNDAIAREHIVVIGVIQVTAETWQPIVQLNGTFRAT